MMFWLALAVALLLVGFAAFIAIKFCIINPRKVKRMFEDGNVCVYGLRGRGKDMLMANIVYRRKKAYVANIDYKCSTAPFNAYKLEDISVPNDYRAFNGEETLKPYKYPYSDGTDVYFSDAGVHFPAQYCNELNKQYKGVTVFLALSRQVGACNMHLNVQSLNRAWDKLREQCDAYINCRSCNVFAKGKIVIQKVRIYEQYDSAAKCAIPFRLKRPLFNRQAKMMFDLEKQRYDQTYGRIRCLTLVYINKTNYDTRFFKTLLEGKYEENSKE